MVEIAFQNVHSFSHSLRRGVSANNKRDAAIRHVSIAADSEVASLRASAFHGNIAKMADFTSGVDDVGMMEFIHGRRHYAPEQTRIKLYFHLFSPWLLTRAIYHAFMQPPSWTTIHSSKTRHAVPKATDSILFQSPPLFSRGSVTLLNGRSRKADPPSLRIADSARLRSNLNGHRKSAVTLAAACLF